MSHKKTVVHRRESTVYARSITSIVGMSIGNLTPLARRHNRWSENLPLTLGDRLACRAIAELHAHFREAISRRSTRRNAAA